MKKLIITGPPKGINGKQFITVEINNEVSLPLLSFRLFPLILLGFRLMSMKIHRVKP